MENYITRSAFSFGIFAFFLYFIKVSNVLSVSTTHRLIDVIKNDTGLCKMPTILYENNITADCYNVTYPEGEHVIAQYDMTYTNIRNSLCLIFYDTLYKVCQAKLQNELNHTTFYSNIQQYFPKENENDETNFCKNIKDIKFAYKKLDPLLSHVHFNNSHVCNAACFNLSGKFIPLCAILSWSKSIDEIKDIGKKSENKKPTIDIKQNSALNETKGDIDDKYKTTSNVKNIALEQESQTEFVEFTTTSDFEKTNLNLNMKESSATNNIFENSEPTLHKKPDNSDNNDNNDTEPKDDKNDINSKTLSKNDEDLKKNENNRINTISNEAEKSMNNINDDYKTSTISDNTEDHENFASIKQNGKLSDDTNDGSDQSDADQDQGIPEPSEQRDISIPQYHPIRTDEESHFLTYLTALSLIFVVAYFVYQHKQKIIAIIVEGRRSRNSRARRRPSTANYRKLDCTLEEAVTSQCNANVTHVIY
ncbi:myb-like protein I isoform X2 [Apis mellifera]|uniref:Myb-like protein I isoform X2 n=1 Tax=Apis mellifera TaxID=7460 RepID=A0A7M7LQ38_APIME|nr:myb-like protein I isoform X2 [Apis mellifera]|eukprot:XP_006558420.1 myb-like protein I isoform X2 [Apis mellifera]